jgi:hypothetical protein
MIRQPEREQLNRLISKTLDQVSIMRGKKRLGCSQFEAEAHTKPRQFKFRAKVVCTYRKLLNPVYSK